MAVLRWIGAQLRALVGLVLPIFRSQRARSGMWTVLGIVVHLLAVALVVVALYFLALYFVVPRNIRIQSEFLKRSWLAILFLLLYALCWLSWWLWKVLTQEEAGEFPDIDRAWEEAVTALEDAGLSLTGPPLFLVLGRPEDEEEALFRAAGLDLDVKQVPARADAPLHLWANRDGIYVTCTGCSLLGEYALGLAGKAPAGAAPAGADPASSFVDDDVLKTLSPSSAGGFDAKLGAVPDMVAVLKQADREGRPLSKVEKRELRRIYRRDNPGRSLVRNSVRMDLLAARLRYLCRLIVRDRHPYCAVNGTLLLVPFAGTDSDDDASHTGQVCQRDLSVSTSALEVHCPLFALVCDLETAPGFTEFVERFSVKERLHPLGRSCPLLPDFQGDRPPADGNGQAVQMVRSLADWLCRSVVQSFVYRKFQFEEGGTGDSVHALTSSNARLFLLFDDLQERSRRLGAILSAAVEGKGGGPLLFGGCYLAGTGTDAGAGEQAFVKGVFGRLLERQSCVYWTPEARRQEATYQFWVYAGWIGLAALIVAAVAIVGVVYF